MAGANMVEQVREGMQVRSSDGKRIGKVRQVHERDADVYIRVAPKASWVFWKAEPTFLYLPASAIAEVSSKQMTLNMDANAARNCTRRPLWIPVLVVDPRTRGG